MLIVYMLVVAQSQTMHYASWRFPPLRNHCYYQLIITLHFSLIIGKWEKFEETNQKAVTKKLLSVSSDDASGGGGAAVCAADAMVSDSQWTALDDSQFAEYDDSQVTMWIEWDVIFRD